MLKINVGFHRRVGEENYGARGASVNLELELDSWLIGEPERLKDRIRQLLRLVKVSVDEELHPQPATNGHAEGSRVNGNGHGNRRQPDQIRRAIASQVRDLNAIAGRQDRDLPGLLDERFGIRDLTITGANNLIQELKGASNGQSRRGQMHHARAARFATPVGQGKDDMAPKFERPYMTRPQFWKLAVWFVAAALLAWPTIGHIGVAVVIASLYIVRLAFLKRSLPACRHFKTRIKRRGTNWH